MKINALRYPNLHAVLDVIGAFSPILGQDEVEFKCDETEAVIFERQLALVSPTDRFLLTVGSRPEVERIVREHNLHELNARINDFYVGRGRAA